MIQPGHPDSRPTPAAALTAWGIACLRAAGVGDADARCVAEGLVQTSLWGIDSHGIDWKIKRRGASSELKSQ